jgi:hypothetical protein
MPLTTKTKIIIGVIVLVVTFAAGRWSVGQKTVKTTEQITATDNKQENKNTHTKTTITETKQPSGADTTVTVIDQVANDTMTQKDISNTNIQQIVTSAKKSALNISVLGAEDFSHGLTQPTYGLSVTKEILPPVTVGAFGLMNGVIGVSIGIDF